MKKKRALSILIVIIMFLFNMQIVHADYNGTGGGVVSTTGKSAGGVSIHRCGYRIFIEAF